MTYPVVRALCLFLATVACQSAPLYAAAGSPVARKAMTSDEQAAFLTKRTTGTIFGTFNSATSMLYAANDVALHTENADLARTPLVSPFPAFYKPTWRELFETVARQTRSSWQYDSARDYWVFGQPQQSQPFEIRPAQGWTGNNQGFYIGFRPTIAPVGMDVYMLGHYSAAQGEDEAKLFGQVREALALNFARRIKNDASAKDMTEVPVGGLKALHFQTVVAQSGITWRQWVIVDSGKAFGIVSAIKLEQDKDIFPDVERMIQMFKPL